ncbi:HK97 family phage prohead protease [Embleya sp. NPDC020886]|uniref:HK97 family phage prohead protease n=1 Tax=Embleya sp. NPDC020886 TaxID=3363980 RepID=UPI0037BB3AEE
MYADPNNHTGEVGEANETGDGLWIKASLDVADNPTTARVHQLLRKRRVTQFSFSHAVLDGAPAKADGDYVFELRKLQLYEVGPTLIGASRQPSPSTSKPAATSSR